VTTFHRVSGQPGSVTDELIMLCAEAARLACLRMTPHHLKALNDSAEQASCLSRFERDRKVTAHAEIFNLPADTACDPVLSARLRDAPGYVYELMVTCGPAADHIVLSSRRRLLALMRAGDSEAVAWEMEQHLRNLRRLGHPNHAAELREVCGSDDIRSALLSLVW